MKDARINYAVVGAFVIVMLAALGVSIALLTGRTGATDPYYAVFTNVTGVKYGTKVTYEGFVVGQVEDIEPIRGQTDTRFKVSLSIREGWAVPADSVVRVAASGILAAVSIDIKGGTSNQMLRPGSQIASGPSANMFAVMNDVAGQVADLNQNALKPLLATVTKQVESLGGLLEQQAPEIMANLLAITGDVQRMSGRLETRVVNDANAALMSQSVGDIAELTAGLKDSRHRLDTMLGSLDGVVTGNRDEMAAAVKDLRYSLQAVSRNIDSITYNLESTTRNFHEFSRQLRDNPGLLIGGRRGEEGRR